METNRRTNNFGYNKEKKKFKLNYLNNVNNVNNYLTLT